MHRQKQKLNGKRLDMDWSCRVGSELLVVSWTRLGFSPQQCPASTSFEFTLEIWSLNAERNPVGLWSRHHLSMFISHRILIRFHEKPTGNPVTGVNRAQSGGQETPSDNVHSPPCLEVKGEYNTNAAWLVCSTQESTKFTIKKKKGRKPQVFKWSLHKANKRKLVSGDT